MWNQQPFEKKEKQEKENDKPSQQRPFSIYLCKKVAIYSLFLRFCCYTANPQQS